jgi:NAD+ synthase (glutamine-hydrolysing)
MVLSTGNKSEMSVGYFTIYGDACGGMAPISDLYKMEVYAIARYINELHGKEMIPQVIIDKEPSAELAPDQRDTDSLPPYPVLDAILRHLVEGEKLSSPTAISSDTLSKVKRLIKNAEFKRRQAAITIKMHNKAFGYGRRIPIAQKWECQSTII